MTWERELRRYIPPGVTNEFIIDTIKNLPCTISSIKQTTEYDAYFKRKGFPKEYTIWMVEEYVEGEKPKLFPKFKPVVEPSPLGLMSRLEVGAMPGDLEDICSRLKIPTTSQSEQMLKTLIKEYGIEFIVKQDRTKVNLLGLEVSLDDVSYHLPSQTPVPPIRNALGEKFHTTRIYEAEVITLRDILNPEESLIYSVTNELYKKEVLGELCRETKEQIGRRVLSQ